MNGPKPPRIDLTWWKSGVVTFRTLVGILETGNLPEKGNLTPVRVTQAKELIELAKAHGQHKPWAFLLYDLKDSDADIAKTLNASRKWVRLTEGRWRQYWIAPMYDSLPNRAEEPHVATVDAPKEENLSTLRVTIPKTFVTSSQWDTALKRPMQLVLECLPKGSSCRGYGWHQIPNHGVVMGSIKLPTKFVDTVLQVSGIKRCLFICIDKDHERKPVSWLETKENQTSMQYLSDAKHQAKTAGVGLALKKGKKNNLGLVGITIKTGEEGLVRKRWVVRGAPNMTPSTFQEFLEKQQWRLVDEIQPPNRRNGLWVFKGVSPIDLPSVGFVRNFGDSQMIFSPWIPKTKKTVLFPLSIKKVGLRLFLRISVLPPTLPINNKCLRMLNLQPPLWILRKLVKMKTMICVLPNERLWTPPKENNLPKFEKRRIL